MDRAGTCKVPGCSQNTCSSDYTFRPTSLAQLGGGVWALLPEPLGLGFASSFAGAADFPLPFPLPLPFESPFEPFDLPFPPSPFDPLPLPLDSLLPLPLPLPLPAGAESWA